MGEVVTKPRHTKFERPVYWVRPHDGHGQRITETWEHPKSIDYICITDDGLPCTGSIRSWENVASLKTVIEQERRQQEQRSDAYLKGAMF